MIQPAPVPPTATSAPARLAAGLAEVRRRRWAMFVYLFTLLCVAIGLDVLTTYVGFQRIGAKFEQNGIGLYLIRHYGWGGIIVLLSLACAATVLSFKRIYRSIDPRWSFWLNVLIGGLCLARWVVVTSDTLWLINGR